MQKTIWYLPSLPLLLATCSWTTTFAVRNHRAEPIRITYFAQPVRSPPYIAAAGQLSEARKNWQGSDSSLVRRDSATLSMRLGPDSLLVLAETGTYAGYWDEFADWFEVKTLRITSGSGERSYSGREVLRAFEKESRTLYVLHFR
jgi:hypothetical protein